MSATLFLYLDIETWVVQWNKFCEKIEPKYMTTSEHVLKKRFTDPYTKFCLNFLGSHDKFKSAIPSQAY